MKAPRIDPGLGPFRRLRLAAELVANAAHDTTRYWRHSFTQGARVRENLRARIAISLHFLEYSLSLTDAKPGHSWHKARMLAEDVMLYAARFGPDPTVEIALGTLTEYVAFNANSGLDLAPLVNALQALRQLPRDDLRGGSETHTAAEIRACGKMDFLRFAEARHSIRSYAPGPVPQHAIDRAVKVAQQSPSSCNRQTCHAWIWTEPADIARVLSVQSGNRGFGHLLGGVAIITSDLCHWETAAERFQGWVDGGMFAMSFAYGLHAEGLGTVMLNWSVTRQQDRALHQLTGLPESALVITMIGFGQMAETLRVPVSQRKPIELARRMNMPLR